MRSLRSPLACILACTAALLGDLRADAAEPPRSMPISGIVRAGNVVLAGVTVVVRAMTPGGEATTRVVTSDQDGTFVVPNAPAGLYTLLAAVPRFPFAVARIAHSSSPDAVSFVLLDVGDSPGILPVTARGKSDPFVARAVTEGDVLRDVAAILAALDDPPPEAQQPPRAGTGSAIAARRLPVHASIASTAGFGSAGGPARSDTAVGVTGNIGERVRWGVDGSYSRLDNAAGATGGDASRFAVVLADGDSQNLQLTTQRQVRVLDESDPERFSAHTLDWSAATGERSQANVSARLVSQSNAFRQGAAADLFARTSDQMDLYAGYRTDLGDRWSVRLSAAYRHAVAPESATVTETARSETRVGAVGGAKVLSVLSVEAGATGDLSDRTRGITPEMTITLHPGSRFRVYASAARRFEQRQDDGTLWAQVSADEADLARISSSLFAGGLRYDAPSGAAVVLEASRRNITGIYRFLLDPDFFERLDSLYFLPGDVATELSSSASGRIASGVEGRLSARVGRISGERASTYAYRSDEAQWAVASAGVHLVASGTSFGVGYRSVTQGLIKSDQQLRNDLSAFDVNVSQALPFSVLQALASDWRALLSVEFAKRQDGGEEVTSNRRMAGGLAVSF
ncbi:MAG: hypothetical protein ACHQPI_12995 [Thermoanaerobaculia bacterium]